MSGSATAAPDLRARAYSKEIRKHLMALGTLEGKHDAKAVQNYYDDKLGLGGKTKIRAIVPVGGKGYAPIGKIPAIRSVKVY